MTFDVRIDFAESKVLYDLEKGRSSTFSLL